MSKSLRVLQIIDTLNAGGAERMAVQIANGLVDKTGFSGLCCTREEGVLKDSLSHKVNYLFAKKNKTYKPPPGRSYCSNTRAVFTDTSKCRSLRSFAEPANET